MDIEKLVIFLPQYLSEYLANLFLTLQKPTLLFLSSELPKPKQRGIHAVDTYDGKSNKALLNPKLISFVILSIFIGSLFQGITPNHPPIKELPTLVVFLMAVWLFISSVIFMIFHFLGGHGKFLDTISVSLQLIAVIYVIASLVSLIATILFFSADTDFIHSFQVYGIVQSFLLAIYLPLSLKGLHFPVGSKANYRFVIATTLSVFFFLFMLIRFFLNFGAALLSP